MHDTHRRTRAGGARAPARSAVHSYDFAGEARLIWRLSMFRGQQAVRFYSRSNELAVVRQVQEALGRLGRVAVERSGSIHIEPGREFHSRLTQTAFSGCLRRRNREYEVRITYCCCPTPVNWAVMALGTLPFLLGWVALLVPLST